MQLAFAKSSTKKKVFSSQVSDDLLPPISLTTDTLNWPIIHDPEGEVNLENWHLSSSDETISLYHASARRTFPTNLQDISFPSPMTRLENKASDSAAQRWRLNTNGQLIDSGWGLANEISRLKLGEADDTEDVAGAVQTPPKSALTAAQLSEGSPLESSSTASVGSSPQAPEHQISLSHSRGSSTDTSISSSRDSSVSNSLQVHAQMGPASSTESKERPRSLTGSSSNADARLNDAGDVQWVQNFDNSSASELSYPSLQNHIHRPQPQLHPNLYDIRPELPALRSAACEDSFGDYNNLRDHNTSAPGLPGYGPVQNGAPAYRQPPRAYPQQGLIGSPNMGFQASHHTAHLSLGSTQQLYDMMLPGVRDSLSVMARAQQQHNVYRATHQHSASDPSAMRDHAALALLANNLQAFGPAIPAPAPLSLYPNQFYGAQETYPRLGLTAADIMATRLQQQYGGAYAAAAAAAQAGLEPVPVVPSPTSQHPGPSTNNRKINLYKTELCRSWEEKGTCRYGTKCQFAHGEDELRKVSRHPKYKTEICRTFWVSGSCPYGKRCCFIHTEVPVNGNINPGSSNVSDGANSQSHTDGRARSMSTNSDPNDTSVSLLARISKRGQETNTTSTPVEPTPKSVSFARPALGSLRVDTSSLDGSLKQNKSAYPSFTSNGILMPAADQISTKSPGPVTAGPDLGRHNAARMEIVGYNNHRASKGGDMDINYKQQSSMLSPIDSATTPRATGHHVRGGSTGTSGNWGSVARNGPVSAFPHGPGHRGNAPWSSTDLAVGSGRLGEKAWA